MTTCESKGRFFFHKTIRIESIRIANWHAVWCSGAQSDGSLGTHGQLSPLHFVCRLHPARRIIHTVSLPTATTQNLHITDRVATNLENQFTKYLIRFITRR